MSTITTDRQPSPDDDQAGTATLAGLSEAGDNARAELSLRMAVRLLARRIHFMAGILVAPLLAVLCLTGIAFAFTPQLVDAVYRHEFFVDTRDSSARPVSEQVDAALATRPNGKLVAVRPPADAGGTTAVVLSVPGLAEGVDRTVYVDPYTNQVRGELTTSWDEPPLQTWLRALHSSLHLGPAGRVYAEVVASWLPVMIIAGVLLWIGHQRRAGRLGWLRGLLTPVLRRGRGRTRARGVHASLGVWLGIGLLAVSVTGLTWSQFAGSRMDALLTAVNAHTPALSAPAVSVPAGATQISVDRVLEVARADGLQGALKITPPEADGKQFLVAEITDGLPIRKDQIAVNPFTGQVTERLPWADYPLLAKLTSLGIEAHSGTLLGLANAIAMALLALSTLVALTLGYRMWWHRRPTGGKSAPAPPPVWSRLPQHVVFLIVLATAAIGWALPVFGVSLAAFVLLDAAINAGKRRAQARSAS
jgi:uncharacterized iron-regulated membrane protein